MRNPECNDVIIYVWGIKNGIYVYGISQMPVPWVEWLIVKIPPPPPSRWVANRGSLKTDQAWYNDYYLLFSCCVSGTGIVSWRHQCSPIQPSASPTYRSEIKATGPHLSSSLKGVIRHTPPSAVWHSWFIVFYGGYFCLTGISAGLDDFSRLKLRCIDPRVMVIIATRRSLAGL